MKVYTVLMFIDYEGQEFMGVFADRESAVNLIKSEQESMKYNVGHFGIVESELGKKSTVDEVEWV